MIFEIFSLAYIGPGSGMTFLGALLAVIGSILFMVVGLVLWPIRKLMGKKGKKSKDASNKPSSDNSTKADN